MAGLLEGAQGTRIGDAEHSGPIPHRQEVWRSPGQSSSRGSSADTSRWLRIGIEEFTVEHPEASQQFDNQTDSEASGIAEVQSSHGEGLPDAGRLPPVLDLQLAWMGVEVP